MREPHYWDVNGRRGATKWWLMGEMIIDGGVGNGWLYVGMRRSATREHMSNTAAMPAPPTPFAPTSSTTMIAPFPALYLYPLNADSFVKHINLTNNQRVKIGRQTNARTVPAETNGYFDSKVLSRQHAEVWEENAKVCCVLLVHPSCMDSHLPFL